MKKVLVAVFTLAFAVACTGCAGGSNSDADTSSSANEIASASVDGEASASADAEAAASSTPAEETTSASTLEEYFELHPNTNALFLSGFQQEFDNTEGLEGSVDVKGNDIVMTLDFTEMYNAAGITDVALARGALEETGAESIKSSLPDLVDTLQSVENAAGISGVRFVYQYFFSGEQIYEICIDSEGNITTSAEAAAAA